MRGAARPGPLRRRAPAPRPAPAAPGLRPTPPARRDCVVAAKKKGRGGPGRASVPLATRWRALTGEARERAAAARDWLLCVMNGVRGGGWAAAERRRRRHPLLSLSNAPGPRHARSAAAALAAATAPARARLADAAAETTAEYRVWRAGEARARWAWEAATPREAAAWGSAVRSVAVFALAIPYMVLAPANVFTSVIAPLGVAVCGFDHPLLNPVAAAWLLVAAAGKWAPGLLLRLAGLGA